MNELPDIPLESIFEHAATLPAAERAHYLDTACAGQPEWRAEIEGLLLGMVAGGIARDTSGVTPELQAELARGRSEQPGERVGAFRLIEQIGEGGFGAVWLAEQERPVRRAVALKIVKMGMDTKEVIARFEQERQALAIMEHPGIAKVFDAGATQNGRPFFAMELVRGERITDYCDARTLPAAERVRLFIAVCQAVQHAHQKGIIHRDLKPSNILVGEDGAPKVIDFGVAKATRGQRLTDLSLQTQAEAMLGTPLYMSPEQVAMDGGDIDTRSDIYSLGVVLYELLAGRTPFDAGLSFDEMRRHIRDVDPPRPSTLRRCAAELDWIAIKALEKDRARRYETANGLAVDLQRHLDDEPVRARPPSAIYLFRKMARRNRIAFASGGVVVAALIAGLLASLWQARRATDANTNLRAQLEAMSRADHVVASGFLSKGEWRSGIAYLARAIENDPQNSAAKEHLWNALLNGSGDRDRLPRAILWHEAGVLDASFSPDGTRAVTASRDQTARLWDAATGQPIGAPMRHDAAVKTAAFSPDGTRIVTASTDGTARLWDAMTGAPLGAAMRHDGVVRGAVFSPDATRILTASDDHTARLWDATTGAPTGPTIWHGAAVRSAVFNKDGARIMTASEDCTARVWDGVTGEPIGESIPHLALRFTAHGFLESSDVGAAVPPELYVHGAAFNPEGTLVVTADKFDSARIRDATAGEAIGEKLDLGPGFLTSAFSPDGTRIVMASWNGLVNIWDVATGRRIGSAMRSDGPAFNVSFSPDGTRIVVASKEQTARVWSASDTVPIGEPLRHESVVWRASFSPDGARIITASEDHTARIWDAISGEPPGEIYRHGDRVVCATFSPSALRLATSSEDHTARVWDAASGRLLGSPLRHYWLVTTVSFSPDESRVVTASNDKAARIWDIESGQPIGDPMLHGAEVKCAVFSPDGRRVATGSTDRTVRIWNAADGRPLGEPLRHDGDVHQLNFNSDGRLLVVASMDAASGVWDVENGRRAGPPLPHEMLHRARFSADGKRVLAGSWRGSVQLWDFTSGRALIAPMTHAAAVEAANFNRDETRIVTASRDKTAQIWDAATGQPIGLPMWHSLELYDANFSPDGARVLTCGLEVVARFWDANSSAPLGELRHDAYIYSARFSPDGARVLTASNDSTARVWSAPTVPRRDAPWLIDLAAAAGGLHFTAQGALEPVNTLKRLTLRERLRAQTVGDPSWKPMIAWLFAPPERQAARMGGTQSFRDVADREIASGQKAALQRILRYDPAHPLLPIALAASESDEKRAAFLREHGLSRLPADASILARAAEMLLAQKQPALAARVAARLEALNAQSGGR
jgi:WD40 repeat protein